MKQVHVSLAKVNTFAFMVVGVLGVVFGLGQGPAVAAVAAVFAAATETAVRRGFADRDEMAPVGSAAVGVAIGATANTLSVSPLSLAVCAVCYIVGRYVR